MHASHGPAAACSRRGVRWGIRLGVALAGLGGLATPVRAAPTAEIPPGTYAIEPAHTDLLFQVRRIGVSKVVGRFDTIAGTLEVPSNPAGGSTLRVAVGTGGVKAGTEKATKMMRGPSFFDVGNHPKIGFTATRVRAVNESTGTVSGMLTLLGVTRPVTFEATFHDGGIDPATGRGILDLSMHGVIQRSDYGMTAYLPFVSDTARLDLEAHMIRRPDTSSAQGATPGNSGQDR